MRIKTERRKRVKCKVCSKPTNIVSYCDSHAKAYEKITKNYECWRKAIEISWKEYLSEIAKNPLTGQWVKETAGYLTKKEGESHAK